MNVELHDEAFQALFEETLVSLRPDPHPVFVSVGGQPGAGKTSVLRTTQDTYAPEHNLYTVNGDLYRRYHPEHDFLISDPDPELFPRATSTLSGALVERTLQWARDEGVSVMVEGTMRRPEITSGTLDSFQRRGFKTHLVVLAVPQAFSWQGCVNRYLLSLHTRGVGRWAPLSAHQAGWEGVEQSLSHVMRCGVADRISVVRRDGSTLFDVEGAQRVQECEAEALEALRVGRFYASAPEVEQWQERQEVIRALSDILPDSIRDEALVEFSLPSVRVSDAREYGERLVRILGGRSSIEHKFEQRTSYAASEASSVVRQSAFNRQQPPGHTL